MKTAEEWANEPEFKMGTRSGILRHEFTRIIKQIQLDAWKQGMSDAIDIVITNNPLGVFKLAETLVTEKEKRTSI